MVTRSGVEFHLDRSIAQDKLRLYVLDRVGRSLAVAKPLLFETIPEGMSVEPCAYLAQDEAQQLMDDLWRCGLRPRTSSSNRGS